MHPDIIARTTRQAKVSFAVKSDQFFLQTWMTGPEYLKYPNNPTNFGNQKILKDFIMQFCQIQSTKNSGTTSWTRTIICPGRPSLKKDILY